MIYIIYFFIFLFGASIGSFLNVLIDRLPQNKKITGRSICDNCQHQLAWYDLIPILSFFILKGRCRYCRKKISFYYPLVEFITGVFFVFIFKDSPFSRIVLLWGIISCFIVIFFSDVKYHLISDYILLSLFVFSLFFHLITNFNLLQLISIYFFSSLIVAFPIWLIYFLSREQAMGLGDVYLSAILGFLLGWQKGFLALYLAFVLGGLVGFFLIIFGRKKLKNKIAFGPFLLIGALVMLFWGKVILKIVLSWYGL